MRIVVLLSLLAAPAWAQDVDCADAMDQTTMNICAGQAYEAADAELNAAYGEAVAAARAWDAADGGDRLEGSLRDAQRAWIAFRDASCDAFALQFEGGSMQPMQQSACLERETRERTDDLRVFVMGGSN